MATNKSKSKGARRLPQAEVSDSSRHQDCALCLEQYKSPRILPCFHTFCLTCLERLTQNSPRTGSFPCPTCRTSVQIPQGGVGKFQVNFYVEAAIESMQSDQGANARLCDMCGTQNATSKCVDCDQFACDNCTAIHARIGAARSHTVLNLNAQNQASPTVMKERYCSTHKDEKVRFFCTQCNCVLCRDCKLTTHEGHPTTDLSKRSQAAKKMLLNVTTKSRTSLTPKLKNSLKRAEKHKEDLVTKKAQILATFRQRAEEIKKTVDTCLKETEENLSTEAGSLEKNVTQTIDDMQQQIACMESLCSHAEQVVKSGCDADILSLPSQMAEFFGRNASNPWAVFLQQNQLGMFSNYPQYNQVGYTNPSNNRLQIFTKENWRQTIQLTDSTTHHGYVHKGIFPGVQQQTNQLKAVISQQIGTVTSVHADQEWIQSVKPRDTAGGLQISQEISEVQRLVSTWAQ
ncbi:hypothetical protein BaRGS_00035270 [Batillaria attramentaria]|uniref:Uncharacterized protein n=1 Tax=Batillaria attramentaria TaxID=370345 RepID=A0ABD0JEU8_9CAEN